MSGAKVPTDWHGRPLKWEDPQGRINGILAILGDLADDPGAEVLHWATRAQLATTLRLLHEERDQMRLRGAAAPKVDDGAAAIVRALAEVPSCAVLGPEVRCALCAEPHRREPYEHDPACPWAMARAWVAAHELPEVDPDTEPPLYDDGPGPEPWQRGAP